MDAMNIKLIDAKKEVTGKYSPNLYSFIKRNPNYCKVYKVEGVLYLGFIDDGDLFGARLMVALCSGSKAETWCYVGFGNMAEEVEDFWVEYIKRGRCCIDPEHNMHFVEDRAKPRWSMSEDGKTRRCLWCGEFTQELETYTFTEERTRWVKI